jgi:Fe-S-cluster containining protein
MPHASDIPSAGLCDLLQAVGQCRKKPAFMEALRALYRCVDQAAADQGAVCMGGGVCCRFDVMGHQLYTSAGELALLGSVRAPDMSRCDRGRCPYQRGPRCEARQVRPLGCRVFFCRGDLVRWSNETYEKYHRQLRRLHKTHLLPYAYVELTAGLAQLGEILSSLPDYSRSTSRAPLLLT